MPTLNARKRPERDQSHPESVTEDGGGCAEVVSDDVRDRCCCCSSDCAWLMRSSDCAAASASTPSVPLVTARVTHGRRSKLRV